MRVDAEKLSSYVNIAVNGMGKKGLNPLNTAITLLNDNGKLSLLTTTGLSTLKVATDIEANEFQSCSVENTIFVQLLSKLSGDIDLNVEEGRNLVIRGKGEYKIIVVFDYNGNFALIDDITTNDEGFNKLDVEELNRAISICKNACPEDLNNPIHYNIYFGDNAVATNDEKLITVPNRSGYKGLLGVNNLGIVTSVFKEDTSYKIDGMTLILKDNKSTLVTSVADASEFPSQVANNITLDNKFEVEYEHIMDVIEKGKLFISSFDRNVVFLDIQQNGLVFRSKNSDFIEEVAYTSPNTVNELKDLQVNLLDLYSILTSCVNGPVTMSCTEDGPFVVTQNEYKGMVSLYE